MSDNQFPANSSDSHQALATGESSAHLDETSLQGAAPFLSSGSQAQVEKTAQTALPLENLSEVKVAGNLASHSGVDLEDDAWESAPLPGTIASVEKTLTTSMTASDAPVSSRASLSEATPSAPPERALSQRDFEKRDFEKRENELLSLIHDLNECNDALLGRISQLERELEGTRAAFNAEVDKAQATHSKMARQVSQEQASAQQISETAQQQVAKLVGQLESAEQSLQRQQLINENLQTELGNAQERITQLERDCALMTQQHAEAVQARTSAETTSRDLRSRLQRQQRYTMQFKAALEKSLTVNARPASSPLEVTRPVAFTDNTPVSMPKAQRIMPWAGSASPFAGIDPHLEALIRNVRKAPDELAAPSPASGKPMNTGNIRAAEATCSDAEDKLWQDLERVMNNAAELKSTDLEPTEPSSAQFNPSKPDSTPARTPEAQSLGQEMLPSQPAADKASAEAAQSRLPQSLFPKLNWQARSKVAQTEAAQAEVARTEVARTEAARTEAAQTETAQTETAQTETAQAKAAQAAFAETTSPPAKTHPPSGTQFTEPSPWGKPLPEQKLSPQNEQPRSERSPKEALKQAAAEAQVGAIQLADPVNAPAAAKAAANQSADYLPAMESAASSISPTAKPLRSQKKLGSLAAVQLPTFPKAKAASFRR